MINDEREQNSKEQEALKIQARTLTNQVQSLQKSQIDFEQLKQTNASNDVKIWKINNKIRSDSDKLNSEAA